MTHHRTAGVLAGFMLLLIGLVGCSREQEDPWARMIPAPETLTPKCVDPATLDDREKRVVTFHVEYKAVSSSNPARTSQLAKDLRIPVHSFDESGFYAMRLDAEQVASLRCMPDIARIEYFGLPLEAKPQ